MNKEEMTFSNELVKKYKENKLTWHDIQDIVMAKYIKDNKKQNEILFFIDKEIDKGG